MSIHPDDIEVLRGMLETVRSIGGPGFVDLMQQQARRSGGVRDNRACWMKVTDDQPEGTGNEDYVTCRFLFSAYEGKDKPRISVGKREGKSYAVDDEILALKLNVGGVQDDNNELLKDQNDQPVMWIDVDDKPGRGIITSRSAATGDRHTYGFKWAEKGSTGYGGWSAITGDTEKTAYNRMEEIDPGTYIDKDPDGDSTNEVTIDGVPVGTPIQIEAVPDGAGGTEYWFSAEVAVSVSCS